MIKRGSLAILILVLATGCATIAGKSRIEKFNDTEERYQRALLQADFRGAAQFIDPEGWRAPIDFDHYQNVKIVAYDIIHTQVDETGYRIVQEVALQYFSLTRNLVKTIEYRPVWQYREDRKNWYLQTALPLEGVQ